MMMVKSQLKVMYASNVQHCFVRVPRMIATQYADAGCHALSIAYYTPQGDECTSFVSFAGQLCDAGEIHIPMALAISLDIRDGAIVDVSLAVGTGVIQGPVYVEPASVDDWEILQLNAGFVEQHLLSQTTVITCDRAFPFWIRTTLVHMKLVSSSPYGWCKLSPLTEVAVAPMLRKRPMTNSVDHFVYRWRVESVVHGTDPLSEWSSRVIMIDTQSYADVCARWGNPHHSPIMRVFMQSYSSSNDDEATDTVIVIPSPLCKRKHILMSRLLRQQHRVSVGSVVYARVHPAVHHQSTPAGKSSTSLPTKYHLHPIEWQHADGNDDDDGGGRSARHQDSNNDAAADITRTFESWVHTLCDNASHQLQQPDEARKHPFYIPLTSRSIIRLHDMGEYMIVNHDDDNEMFLRVAPRTRMQISSKVKQFTCILGSTVYEPLVREPLDRVLSIVDVYDDDDGDDDDERKSPVSYVAGVDDTLDCVYEFIMQRLNDEYIQRMSDIGVLPASSGHCASGLVVCGGDGVGKTAVLSVTAWKCRHRVSSTNATTYIQWVNCRDLVNENADVIIDTLATHVNTAVFNAPTLLILDDIDVLMPHTPSNSDAQQRTPVSLRTHIVADRLADMILTAQLTCFERRTPLVCVASASSYASIHESLRATGMFVESVIISQPTIDQRRAILEALIRRYSPNEKASDDDDDSVDFRDVALRTEGYVARDLQQVVARAMHMCVSTNIRACDMNAAMKHYTPVALKDMALVKTTVSWDDIGGLHTVRATVTDTFDLPSRFAPLFAHLPIKLRCGLLLYGPPGCGKTLVATAIAKESSLNFISVKGPELLNKYIGGSEENVRRVFERAATAAPCILFFDEFDSIAPKRGNQSTGVTDRVVNQLLTQLDGVEGRDGVYILAASSRPDLIDPALLRPGRLDKSLYCGYPDASERYEILNAITRKITMTHAASEYLHTIATTAQYYSGADLQGIITTAQVTNVHEWIKTMTTTAAASTTATTTVVSALDRHHLEHAFTESSPSISADDRRMFERIYKRFIESRDKTTMSSEFDPNAPQRTILR